MYDVNTYIYISTKQAVQEVHLDKNIKLLDCPGVVMADGDSINVALRSCVGPELLPDPVAAVQV